MFSAKLGWIILNFFILEGILIRLPCSSNYWPSPRKNQCPKKGDPELELLFLLICSKRKCWNLLFPSSNLVVLDLLKGNFQGKNVHNHFIYWFSNFFSNYFKGNNNVQSMVICELCNIISNAIDNLPVGNDNTTNGTAIIHKIWIYERHIHKCQY